jgi:hypothetical protein
MANQTHARKKKFSVANQQDIVAKIRTIVLAFNGSVEPSSATVNGLCSDRRHA